MTFCDYSLLSCIIPYSLSFVLLQSLLVSPYNLVLSFIVICDPVFHFIINYSLWFPLFSSILRCSPWFYSPVLLYSPLFSVILLYYPLFFWCPLILRYFPVSSFFLCYFPLRPFGFFYVILLFFRILYYSLISCILL